MQKKYVDVLREVLSDKGVHIIKKYIPIINNLINEYLQAMDFFVSFHLDEEFNETVKSRHRDTFNYNSFSEGEKLRIDLALLFTWRTIAKMKNSVNTNLLILDEIFDSSLDQQGTDDFFKIVNKLKNENVFIISHKGDILFDKFTNILKFESIKTLLDYKIHRRYMKELKLIPPTDPRVQSAIAPFNNEMLKDEGFKDRKELSEKMFDLMKKYGGIGLSKSSRITF